MTERMREQLLALVKDCTAVETLCDEVSSEAAVTDKIVLAKLKTSHGFLHGLRKTLDILDARRTRLELDGSAYLVVLQVEVA